MNVGDEDRGQSAGSGRLGRRVTEIPCMRTSLLYGIGGGFTVGLISFMFTSNVRRSTRLGFGTYILGTMGVWTYCRYQWSATRMKQRQIKYALEQNMLKEGTALERELETRSQEA